MSKYTSFKFKISRGKAKGDQNIRNLAREFIPSFNKPPRSRFPVLWGSMKFKKNGKVK